MKSHFHTIKCLTVFILTSLNLTAIAQYRIIAGIVVDNNGDPLSGFRICQSKTNNCTNSNLFGLFKLPLDELYPFEIIVRHGGYKDVHIGNLDTANNQLRIQMDIDTSSEEYMYTLSHLYYPVRKLKYKFIPSIGVNYHPHDFSNFTQLINHYNIDLMNKHRGVMIVGIACNYRNFIAGINFGGNIDTDNSHDSLYIKLNTTYYGLHFDYNLLNTNRWLLTPAIGISWNKFRLLNYDKIKSIPMYKYISDRDLDIRFNQIIGSIGLGISYKIYKPNMFKSTYWAIGVYGGYIQQLNKSPWIYSRGNKLETTRSIEIENYSIGTSFSFIFD